MIYHLLSKLDAEDAVEMCMCHSLVSSRQVHHPCCDSPENAPSCSGNRLPRCLDQSFPGAGDHSLGSVRHTDSDRRHGPRYLPDVDRLARANFP